MRAAPAGRSNGLRTAEQRGSGGWLFVPASMLFALPVLTLPLRQRGSSANAGPPSLCSQRPGSEMPSSVSGSFRSRGEGLALVGPCERLGGRVVAPDEGEQLGPEVGLRLEDAAAEEPAGEDREEQLDLVEPGGVGGGEVEGPA